MYLEMKVDLEFNAMTIARDLNICEGCECQEFIDASRFTCKAMKTVDENECIKRWDVAEAVENRIRRTIPVNVERHTIGFSY